MTDQELSDLACEYFGKGDSCKAIDTLTEGAEANGLLCLNGLRYCFLKGQGVDQDLSKAIALTRRGVALG